MNYNCSFFDIYSYIWLLAFTEILLLLTGKLMNPGIVTDPGKNYKQLEVSVVEGAYST